MESITEPTRARTSRRRTGLRAGIAALALIAGFAVVGCGSSSSSSTVSSTSTTAAPKKLQIVVTNDDGYDAEGISTVVEALRAQPNVDVTVVAPATNQSGKGGATTPGALSATDARTKAGYPAKAVAGTPADSINWALDQKGISFTPDLVVAGINAGANMGPVVDLSGTVGAARAAVAHSIPAIAVSQGPLAAPFDFAAGAKQLIDWFVSNRAAIADGSITHTTVFNMNIPSCVSGAVRGPVNVPPATTADGYAETPNCASTTPAPGDDIKAYLVGFAPISALPARSAS